MDDINFSPLSDTAVIKSFFETITRRWAEIGADEWLSLHIRLLGNGKKVMPLNFKPDQDGITMAAEAVADLTAKGRDAYCCPNPMRENVAGTPRDDDMAAGFHVWCDCDDEAATEALKAFDGPKYSHVVLTGTIPHHRAHAYWELAEPMTDLAEWTGMQKRIAAKLGSDAVVCNPSRLMRIPGTITWPSEQKQKRGYVSEVTQMIDKGSNPVEWSSLDRAFAQAAPQAASAPLSVLAANTNTFAETPLEDALSALEAIPNNLDRSEWLKIANALKLTYGDQAKDAFVEWSATWTGGESDPAEDLRAWQTLKPDGSATMGSVIWMAQQAGWGRREAFVQQEPDLTFGQSAPDMTLLHPSREPIPPLPCEEVFGSRWGEWISQAATAKGAPTDYVATALLSVVGSLIGNARWVAPWEGWAEPPILWGMLIGLPSANKSPALDAVIDPLKAVQKRIQDAASEEYAAWADQKEKADLALADWKKRAAKAVEEERDPPAKPNGYDPGPEPHIPRLVVNDSTIERLAEIAAAQPRGTLSMRDELSGWLGNMSRYSSGSDQPFWLEAYGGRGYSIERMSRHTHVDRLTIGVLGGIQPDKLMTLLLKADDDGMLARFMPVWPDPVPIEQPDRGIDNAFAERAFSRFHELAMPTDESGSPRTWFVPLSADAQAMLTEFRKWGRDQEASETGLIVSFIGKAPGMAIRLALILAHLDWFAGDDVDAPQAVTTDHLGRACHYVEAYLLPMARRAYAGASVPQEERAASALARIIHREELTTFSSRDIQRRRRSGLRSKKEIDPAIDVLVQAGWITVERGIAGPQGGRRRITYHVNPMIRGAP